MTLLPIVILAAAAFIFAVVALRLPKSGWTLMGAAILFGLAGYALQGSPGQAGAPKSAQSELAPEGAALVDARREMYGPTPPSSFVTLSDGFARRGQYADAAGILRTSITDNPRDSEAWLALGNALVEHADGNLTPAALAAFQKADLAKPGTAGPGFFLGVALIRNGRMQEARTLWAEMIAKAQPGAEWRGELQQRLDRLDALIAAIPPQ